MVRVTLREVKLQREGERGREGEGRGGGGSAPLTYLICSNVQLPLGTLLERVNCDFGFGYMKNRANQSEIESKSWR